MHCPRVSDVDIICVSIVIVIRYDKLFLIIFVHFDISGRIIASRHGRKRKWIKTRNWNCKDAIVRIHCISDVCNSVSESYDFPWLDMIVYVIWRRFSRHGKYHTVINGTFQILPRTPNTRIKIEFKIGVLSKVVRFACLSGYIERHLLTFKSVVMSSILSWSVPTVVSKA